MLLQSPEPFPVTVVFGKVSVVSTEDTQTRKKIWAEINWTKFDKGKRKALCSCQNNQNHTVIIATCLPAKYRCRKEHKRPWLISWTGGSFQMFKTLILLLEKYSCQLMAFSFFMQQSAFSDLRSILSTVCNMESILKCMVKNLNISIFLPLRGPDRKEDRALVLRAPF